MPMAFPMPFVGPQHHRAFKEMFGTSWPRSYLDWLSRHSREKIGREKSGFKVQEIQIEPEELRRYAKSYDRTPSMDMLSSLAIEKAMDLSVPLPSAERPVAIGRSSRRSLRVDPQIH